MAIGLSKVNSRKAPRTVAKKSRPTDQDLADDLGLGSFRLSAAVMPELKISNDAWSARGMAREGRSSRRERGSSAGDLNMLWFDWTQCVAGTVRSTRILEAIRRILELEMFVFEFLVHDLELPRRAKKRILAIRSRNERLFSLIAKEA